MYCIKCGKQIIDGAVFCGECGASLTGVGTDNSTATETQADNHTSVANQKCPKVVQIACWIYIISGVVEWLTGSDLVGCNDTVSYAAVSFYLGSVAMIVAAYLFRVGHRSGRIFGIAALVLNIPHLFGTFASGGVLWILLNVLLPLALTYLKQSDKWLSRFSSISKSDVKLLVENFKGLNMFKKVVVVVILICAVVPLCREQQMGWFTMDYDTQNDGKVHSINICRYATYNNKIITIEISSLRERITILHDDKRVDWLQYYEAKDFDEIRDEALKFVGKKTARQVAEYLEKCKIKYLKK